MSELRFETTEERQMLALEAIAETLASIDHKLETVINYGMLDVAIRRNPE